MEIILNNKQEVIPVEVNTIGKLLKYKTFSFPRIVVKINNRLIRKPDYDQAIIQENDRVEIIHLVSGG